MRRWWIAGSVPCQRRRGTRPDDVPDPGRTSGRQVPSSVPRRRRPLSSLTVVQVEPRNAETPLSALGGPTVPNERFYVRSNFGVPRLEPAAWRLDVGGAVGARVTLSLADLAALPWVERTVTLECAGNGRTLMRPVPAGTPWRLGAVGTARFGGVRLRDVLARVSLAPDAVEVVSTGADRGALEPDGEVDYAFGLPRAIAESDEPLLAWEMNGEPLPPEHGFPVRLVVPGQYAMRSVKWLTRIVAVRTPFDGPFPRRYRYRGDGVAADGEPVGPIRVRSLLLEPADGAVLDGSRVMLRGIAWSGGGPIVSVEIDTGAGWRPARLDPPTDPAGHTGWSLEWTPPGAGSYVVRARATDASGDRQPDRPRWNEGGYGNNVVQRSRLTIG